jgi:regulator of replication initiation timing
MEELTWLNNKHFNHSKNSINLNNENLDGSELSDLMNSYQQKISFLHDEISGLKKDITDRDKEISQLRIQYKILKQRSQSVDRSSDDNVNNDTNRFKRGISVDGGGNLREQLEASNDEIRLLKNKLLRLEDELNNSVLEKETLLVKLDDQSKQGIDHTINKDLQIFTDKISKIFIIPRQNYFHLIFHRYFNNISQR